MEAATGTGVTAATGGQYQRYRVMWPLVPAMAMVMIDFTIVSISATTIQQDLHLSETGVQWLVTAYALATAAFIALGGRLGDIVGHKRIVAIGIVTFASFSLLCGLTPDTSAAEPWMIVCRVFQGIGGRAPDPLDHRAGAERVSSRRARQGARRSSSSSPASSRRSARSPAPT